MNEHTMSELAALYALDALEGDEREEFETHLAGCASCQEEVNEYRSAAANLVADQPSSDETWTRIAAAISGEEGGEVISIDRSEPGGSSGWKWVAAAAAVAAVVLAGILVTQLVSQPTLDQQIVAAAEQTAGQPGSIVGEFLVDDVSVAQIVLGSDGNGYVIPSDDLEPLDPSRTYQLWVINDTEDVISAGVLGSAPAPATFTWTGDVAGFALTREVAGGVVSSAGDVVAVIADV